nr:DNA (cytosine-5-)-methyltransferase [Pelistega indica]
MLFKQKKQPFILLENVDRLLKSPSSRRGRDFAIMLKTLDDLGYFVHWRVINAGDYGMPQKRRRVFIFAFHKTLKFAQKFLTKDVNLIEDNFFNSVFPIERIDKQELCSLVNYTDVLAVSNSYAEGKFEDMGVMHNGIIWHAKPDIKDEVVYPLSQIIQQAVKYHRDSLSAYVVANEKLDKWKYLKGAKRIERKASNGHQYIYSEGAMAFPEKMEEPARTMLTSEGTLNRSSHIIFDEQLQQYRILTPVECELIQMFPPHWTDTMPNRNRYFMMGNALVTGIIRRLEPKLREIILAE